MDRPTRPFRISDACVLVAAAALGVVIVRPALPLTSPAPTRGTGVELAWYYTRLVAHPTLVSLSAAAVALCLRPPFARSARDPGVVLGLAALAAAFMTVVQFLGYFNPLGPRGGGLGNIAAARRFQEQWLVYSLADVPLVVAGAALALAVTGQIRPGREWPQRFAWWVGFAWVARLFIGTVVAYLV